MSLFNIDTFLDSTVEGQIASKRIPLPEGPWAAEIVKLEPRSQRVQRGQHEEMAYILDVHFEISDPVAVEATKSSRPVPVVHGIWLNLNAEGTGLDLDNNIQLGQLRKAVGQENEEAWSPSMLMNQGCMVNIINKPDPNNPDNVYNRVRGFAPIE